MADTPNNGPPDPPEPDNVRRIHHLVRMMHKYDLAAIDLVEGSTKIRLRRRNHVEAAPSAQPAAPLPGASTPQSSMPAATGPEAPNPASAESASAAGSGSASGSASEDLFVESPMVGTFYQSSSPDAPSFVSVGSVVRPETTVCIIEAMKVFTEIPAGVSGTIAEVLVEDKQPVEFGQPLFRVRPS